MAMYRYYTYLCDKCDFKFEAMRDKNTEDIEKGECPDCLSACDRVPDFGILKGEIEEKTHGGRLHNGKMIRRFTGFKEIREERALERQMRAYQKNGKVSEAIEAAKEVGAKKKESTGKALK